MIPTGQDLIDMCEVTVGGTGNARLAGCANGRRWNPRVRLIYDTLGRGRGEQDPFTRHALGPLLEEAR